MIADQTRTAERGRAIGVNDSFAAGASVTAALVTGPLIALWGLAAAGVAAILLAVIPFLLSGLCQRDAGATVTAANTTWNQGARPGFRACGAGIALL